MNRLSALLPISAPFHMCPSLNVFLLISTPTLILFTGSRKISLAMQG